MLAKKKSIGYAAALIAVAVCLTGCTPAGPRAFFAGKKYLDEGDYANAAARFKIAATVLATNAVVWDYYGMALQADHQPQAAAAAYQRALEVDRDLVEAHFNLGGLWLEQNQPDEARTEFTAYTLRRSNDPDGWLRLGSAQLRINEIVGAEKSFSKVLYLRPGDAAAYNGLGLARMYRGMAKDAARYFAAAIKSDPGFPSAILNLATVSHQYLRDDKTALANYQAYLALSPRPADWDQVNALANQLEHPVATIPQPVAVPAPLVEKPHPASTDTARYFNRPSVPRPEPSLKKPVAASSTAVANHQRPPAVTPAMPVQEVEVAPPPQIIASPRAMANLPPTQASAGQPQVEQPLPAQPDQKTGFWQRLFTPSQNQSQQETSYTENGVTPLPSGAEASDSAKSAERPVAPEKPAPVPLSRFPRYEFISPPKPATGNHANGTPASGAFVQAQLYEQDQKWSDALQYYQQAAWADPSWFVAQYNTAVLAQRLRIYSQSLAAYEYALAIEPDSLDTRYNFALALRAAGYIPDAINQFKKVLAARPDYSGAHLALGNIYAQTLHETAIARQYYVKVLELDPQSPQAANIRFWLADNPE